MLTASDIARSGVAGTSTAERRKRAEFLAWALADFQRFVGLCKIIPKDGVKRRFILNDIQRRYCSTRTARDTILKPRQIGFTTLEQARDIYTLITKPGARVVTTCQSMTDHTPALQLSANYGVMFTALREAGLALNFRSESAMKWVLAERDASLRIVEAGASEAAAQKKGRAGTVTRLHCTETAFYDYADDTLNALMEAVPGPEHGSEIVNESTANGAGGWFHSNYKAAEAGTNGFRAHFFPWFDASEYALELEPGEVIEPRTPHEEMLARKGVKPEQLKWYRRKVTGTSQDKTDQEYPSDPETCFLASGRSFFDQAVTKVQLEAAPSEPLEKRNNDRLWIWKLPQAGHGYVIGADAAEGVGKDDSAAPVLDWITGEHVATILGDLQPYDYAAELACAGYLYNTALIAVERANHGHAVLQALVHPPANPDGSPQHAYPCLYVAADEKLGWVTSPVTRPVMLDDLAEAHRQGFFKTPDRRLLQQVKTFVVPANGKPQAASGEKDDLVLGAAIGWEVRQRGGWVPPQVAEEIQPYERTW